MQNAQNTSTNATPHHMQQHGKGFNIVNGVKKIKVRIGDEERAVDQFKIVATWSNPFDPKKPTYAFPSGMVYTTYEKNGVFPESVLQAIKFKVNEIVGKCKELKVYDNRPSMLDNSGRRVINPYKILAWWQNGQWLPVEHPQAKYIIGK